MLVLERRRVVMPHILIKDIARVLVREKRQLLTKTHIPTHCLKGVVDVRHLILKVIVDFLRRLEWRGKRAG
jgi:hypothetical protein